MKSQLMKSQWLLIPLLALGANTIVSADDASDIEQLKKDVTKLKKEKSKHKIIGLLQTIYADTDGAKGSNVPGGTDSGTSSFFVKRARLGVKGKVGKGIGYKFLSEFDNGSDSSTPRVLDALVSIKLGGSTKIKVGQFKYAYDIEGYSSAADLPFIERNLGVATFAHPDRKYCRYRDRGVMASFGKKKDKWQINASILNGSGISRRDTNDDKDFVLNGRLWPTKGLLVNAGIYSGTSDANGAGQDDIDKYTLGFQYDLNEIVLGGEYYSAEFTKANQDWQSLYAYGVWRMTPKWDLGLRYSELEDDNVSNSTLDQTDLVLTYYMKKKNKGLFRGQKISLRYSSRDSDGALAGKAYKGVARSLGLRGGDLTGATDVVGDLVMLQLQLEY